MHPGTGQEHYSMDHGSRPEHPVVLSSGTTHDTFLSGRKNVRLWQPADPCVFAQFQLVQLNS